MGPVIVMAVLTWLVATGILEFNTWRSRRNLSPSLTASLIALALLGLAFLALELSLDPWPAVVVLLAMFAFHQQNRIENFLVHGWYKARDESDAPGKFGAGQL